MTTTTCTTCGTRHDSGIEETVTACPACPTERARDLADIAADRLTRLAEDLDYAARVPVAHDNVSWTRANAERTIVASRSEAAGALERLGALFPTNHPTRLKANAEADLVARPDASPCRAPAKDPDTLRRWADQWRAYAAR